MVTDDDELSIVDLDESLWGNDSSGDEHGEDAAATSAATTAKFAQGPLMELELEVVANLTNLCFDIGPDVVV